MDKSLSRKKFSQDVEKSFYRVLNRLGFSRPMIKIISSIFTEGKPLSQDELKNLTGYSKSLISTSLAVLQFVGVVEIYDVVESRKNRYYFMDSLPKIVENLYKNIFENEINGLYEAISSYSLVNDDNINTPLYKRTLGSIEKILKENNEMLRRISD